MIKIIDIVEDSGIARSSIDRRIEKLKINVTKVRLGVGGATSFVSEEDAETLVNYKRVNKWHGYIKSSEIAIELGLSVKNVIALAHGLNVHGRYIRREGQRDNLCICYSPKEYKIIIGKRKPKGTGIFLGMESTNQITENRSKGLYTRLTPYGGIL